MHRIARTIVLITSLATSSLFCGQAPVPQQAKEQKEKQEAGVALKKPKVEYGEPHRRLSSIAMGKSFVAAALQAARKTGVQELEKYSKDYLELFINSQDLESRTALHAVAFAGGPHAKDVMHFLLNHPLVKTDSVDAQGHIPLMEAVRGGQLEMLNILAQHDASRLNRKSIVMAQNFAVQQKQNDCVKRLDALLTECLNRKSQQSQLINLAHMKGASKVLSQSQLSRILSKEREYQGLVADESQPSGGCCCLGSSSKVYPAPLIYTATTPTTQSN